MFFFQVAGRLEPRARRMTGRPVRRRLLLLGGLLRGLLGRRLLSGFLLCHGAVTSFLFAQM